MLFLDCLALDVVERGCRFDDVPIRVSVVDEVYLPIDMVAEILVVST